MIAGTLLSDHQFVCKDGSVQNKIIVLLSDGQTGTYIVAKATSKGHRYGLDFGCQPLGRFPCFFLPRNSCCLELDTWIQLEAFYEFGAYELEKKVIDANIYQIGHLTNHIEALLICSINSEDLTPFQERLLQAALAAHKKSMSKPTGSSHI